MLRKALYTYVSLLATTFVGSARAALNCANKRSGHRPFMVVQAQLCDILLVTNTVDIESLVPKSNRSCNGGYRIQTSKGGRGRCNRYIILANSVAVILANSVTIDFSILRLVLLVLLLTVLGFILWEALRRTRPKYSLPWNVSDT
jgi:hypothetical protein